MLPVRLALRPRGLAAGTVGPVSRVYPEITAELSDWIARQSLFFVATAPLSPEGSVNLSPKGPIGSLRVLGPAEVAYLDIVGSGVETAAHLEENGRVTLMLCAFDGPPRILRLYGRGTVVWAEDPAFDALRRRCAFDEPAVDATRRAIVHVRVTRIADACGFGVPLMDFRSHRGNADRWAKGKLARGGVAAIIAYKRRKNRTSIDGLPAWPGTGQGPPEGKGT